MKYKYKRIIHRDKMCAMISLCPSALVIVENGGRRPGATGPMPGEESDMRLFSIPADNMECCFILGV